MTSDLTNRAAGFGLAAAAAIVANLVMVVAKETSPAVMAGMKAALGHHWITHSAVVLAVFVVLGLGLSRVGAAKAVSAAALSRLLVAAAAAGGGGILAFYGLFS